MEIVKGQYFFFSNSDPDNYTVCSVEGVAHGNKSTANDPLKFPSVDHFSHFLAQQCFVSQTLFSNFIFSGLINCTLTAQQKIEYLVFKINTQETN